MTFRIQTRTDKEGVTFSLSGEFDPQGSAELQKLLRRHSNGHRVIIDLAEVSIVGRSALRSLAACEVRGVELRNCPAYVRDWISKEQKSFRRTNGGKKQ